MKALVFDAGALINFSMNGLLDILVKLKKEFPGKFLVTSIIVDETINRPLGIKRYELGAMMIRELLKKNVVELPSSVGIKDDEIEALTLNFLSKANKIFFAKDRAIHLIDKGEASCLALSELLNKKGIENLIVIDERTTRMLCERPDNLHKLLKSKLHTKIEIKKDNFSVCTQLRFIRSCELLYIAYKKGLLEIKDKNLLDALLYAVKYKGCSVSHEEIVDMKAMQIEE